MRLLRLLGRSNNGCIAQALCNPRWLKLLRAPASLVPFDRQAAGCQRHNLFEMLRCSVTPSAFTRMPSLFTDISGGESNLKLDLGNGSGCSSRVSTDGLNRLYSKCSV